MNTQLDLTPALHDYIKKSGVALALSAIEDDAPLLVVNEAFCDMTGYSEDEVVGHNCRFLQGPDTNDSARQPLHDFVHGNGGDSGRFPILNYRKDGSAFHNYVFMSRLKDTGGQPQFILASQFDMTTALKRSQISLNDEKLQDVLSDVGQIGREFGLAMMGSAGLLADSIALMAKLTFDDSQR